MIDFVLEVEAPVELQLLASALVARVPDGGRLIEGPAGEGLVVRIDENRSVSVHSRPGRFVVGGGEDIAWFLPIAWPSHPIRCTNLRIGIAGGDDQRRLRMSWRTIAELRSRGIGFESIVLGRCVLPASAPEKPDEVHDELTPAEYLAALDRIDIVLECTDTFETESFLAVAGRDRGLPVVAHRDRPELSRANNRHAEAWSADGFAEAIQETMVIRVAQVDPATDTNRLVELIGIP